MAGLIKVGPLAPGVVCGAAGVSRWGLRVCRAGGVRSEEVFGRDAWAASGRLGLARAWPERLVCPRAPLSCVQEQQQGGGASSDAMLKDLAAYLTLEKAQVRVGCMAARVPSSSAGRLAIWSGTGGAARNGCSGAMPGPPRSSPHSPFLPYPHPQPLCLLPPCPAAVVWLRGLQVRHH